MSDVVVPSGLLRVRQTVRSLGRPGDFLCCGFWNEELPADVEGVYSSYVAVWILRGRVRLRDWRGQVHRLGAGGPPPRGPRPRPSSAPRTRAAGGGGAPGRGGGAPPVGGARGGGPRAPPPPP